MDENSSDGFVREESSAGASSSNNDTVTTVKETARSIIWESFTKVGEGHAKCNTCAKIFKVTGSSTTTLWRHFRSHAVSQVNNDPPDAVCLDPNSSRAKELTQAIANMMIWDLEPYHMVNRKGFRALIKTLEPRYVIPSRTTFSREIIPALYAQQKECIRQIITRDIEDGVTSIAFTTDGWTSRAIDSYISLTIHYVTKDFEPRKFMLAMTYVAESHTSKNLHDVLKAIIVEWGLDKITIDSVYFITDNAPNIVGAIRMGTGWFRIPCFAHTLQLVVKDAVKESPAFVSTCRKTQAIVGFFARSSTGQAKFINAQKQLEPDNTVLKLIQNVDTRWNSQYEMFERLLRLRKALCVVLCDRGMPTNLTESEWQSVEEYVKILEPVKEATDLMSGETYPCLSQYIPVVQSLKNAATTDSAGMVLDNDVDVSESDLVGSLSDALQRRFAFATPINDCMVFAMVLDPRFKDRFIQSATEKHEIIKRLKWKATFLYRKKIPVASDRAHSSRSDAQGEPKSKLRKIFDMFLDSEDDVDEEHDVDTELQLYLEEKVVSRKISVYDWWSRNRIRYPILAHAAQQYLNIPAAQTTSERLFSTAGNIVTPNRCQLLSAHVEQLAFLHENCE